MNWGLWLQGLISSFASAAITVLTALVVLPQCPAGWQLFIIAVGPFLINFFSYIKQTPPPIGKTPPLIIWLLAIGLTLNLMACATPWQKKSVSTYELAGIVPSAVCNRAQDICKTTPNTLIPEDKCIQLKKICNDGKKVYVIAGSSLSVAIDTADAIDKNTLLIEYNKLMFNYGVLAAEILQLGAEFKLIK